MLKAIDKKLSSTFVSHESLAKLSTKHRDLGVKPPQMLKQWTKFGRPIQLDNQTNAGAVRRHAANLLWQTIRLTLMLAAVKPELNEVINLQLPAL